jgi:signal transduction histidine kinase
MRTFAGRGHKVAVHDLSEVMDRQMNLLTRGMPRDIDVKWRRSTEELPVMLDPLQIARVLTNLCANAANAMPEGGRLDVRTAKVSYGGKESAALIVSDSGRGIDPKQLRKIFDPFFSGQASKTGQGLGLAIVRGIVQEHDGKIEVVSHPGRGTTVTAYFPLHAGPAEPAADAA